MHFGSSVTDSKCQAKSYENAYLTKCDAEIKKTQVIEYSDMSFLTHTQIGSQQIRDTSEQTTLMHAS